MPSILNGIAPGDSEYSAVNKGQLDLLDQKFESLQRQKSLVKFSHDRELVRFISEYNNPVRLAGIADGIEGNDAVNRQQLDGEVNKLNQSIMESQRFITSLDNHLYKLSNDYHDTRENLKKELSKIIETDTYKYRKDLQDSIALTEAIREDTDKIKAKQEEFQEKLEGKVSQTHFDEATAISKRLSARRERTENNLFDQIFDLSGKLENFEKKVDISIVKSKSKNDLKPEKLDELFLTVETVENRLDQAEIDIDRLNNVSMELQDSIDTMNLREIPSEAQIKQAVLNEFDILTGNSPLLPLSRELSDSESQASDNESPNNRRNSRFFTADNKQAFSSYPTFSSVMGALPGNSEIHTDSSTKDDPQSEDDLSPPPKRSRPLKELSIDSDLANSMFRSTVSAEISAQSNAENRKIELARKETEAEARQTVLADTDTVAEAKQTVLADTDTVSEAKQAVLADKGTVAEAKQTVLADKGTVAEAKQTVLADTDTVAEAKQAVLADKGTVAEAKQTVLADTDTVAEAKQTVLADTDTVAEAKQAVLADKGTVAEAKQAVLADKGTVAEAKQAVLADTDTVAEAKQTVLTDKDTVSEAKQTVLADTDTVAEAKQTVLADTNTVAEAKQTVLADTNTVAEAKQTVLADTDTVAEAKQAVLADKGTVAEAKQTVLADTDTVAEAKQTVLADKGTVAEAKQTVLADTDTVAGAKQTVLIDKDVVAEAKQTVLANKDVVAESTQNILAFEMLTKNMAASAFPSGSHSNAVLYDDDQRNSVTLGGTDSKTPVKVSNVAPGKISEDSTDAVNGAQLFQSTMYSMNKSMQYTDHRFSEVVQGMNDMRQSINNVANHAYSGVAAAMAMPSMGPTRPGGTMVSIGTASFKGRKATGVGVTYRSRGGQMIINAAASKAGSDTGMRVQVGYEF
ncbi:YadA-like family protein [Mycoavidus sp. HKI]|nr:YadA-like family protein [Mycoavidus sp. HKI]